MGCWRKRSSPGIVGLLTLVYPPAVDRTVWGCPFDRGTQMAVAAVLVIDHLLQAHGFVGRSRLDGAGVVRWSMLAAALVVVVVASCEGVSASTWRAPMIFTAAVELNYGARLTRLARRAPRDRPRRARPRAATAKKKASPVVPGGPLFTWRPRWFAWAKIGSGGGTRTPDMVVNSHPLYQLSYAGMERYGCQRRWRTSRRGGREIVTLAREVATVAGRECAGFVRGSDGDPGHAGGAR